jgi:prolipoprotein diacylglyceryl transferase
MPAAFLPSPASDIWHLGPFPVRAFALCMVAGVLAGLWLTDWRYRRAGGQQGIVLNVATVAVPVGIIGARIYSVATNYRLYFGPGKDWVSALRIWEGGLGVAGAVAAGAVATWAYCRQHGIELGPLALAAAPALPVAQAIAVWGNWFSQSLYGHPSGVPWAVEISPAHRASGYQAVATFQPIFLYESLLYLLVAVAVGYSIRRFALTGVNAFALYAGLYATARFFVEAQRVGYTPRVFGLRTNEAAMLAILLAAWSYLLVARSQRKRALAGLGRRRRVPPQPVRSPRPLRARSGTAVAARLDLPPEAGVELPVAGSQALAAASGPVAEDAGSRPASGSGSATGARPARGSGPPAAAASAAAEPAARDAGVWQAGAREPEVREAGVREAGDPPAAGPPQPAPS